MSTTTGTPSTPVQNTLVARGRIVGESEAGVMSINAGAKVDGARLWHLDHDREVAIVRVDHSTIPGFWLELELPLEQFAAWLAQEVKEYEEDVKEATA